MNVPLLRAPPFPGIDASVTRPGTGAASAPGAIDDLFGTIRDARVGGSFWGAPHGGVVPSGRRRSPAKAGVQDHERCDLDSGLLLSQGNDGASATVARRPAPVILRCRSADDIEQTAVLLSAAERATPPLHLPADAQTDPWSLLQDGVTLVAHGDDEWVAIAVIAGADIRLLSVGRFGAPGDATARLRRTVADDLTTTLYRNPFTGQDSSIERTIELLAGWRETLAANHQIVAACGFSWWKRREIARFLWTPEHPLRFFRSEWRAIEHAKRHNGAVAIWPSRVSGALITTARVKNVPLVRVEDGFVRSVGLGSNLVPPSSVTVDRRGIHYDPGLPSDLEAMLAEANFTPPLLARAAQLRETILKAGISKYGGAVGPALPARTPGRRLVLVPGQVEDDMSVRLGGGGLSSNLDLLCRARALEPDAEIWFRPHPDVDAGHRKGTVRDADALAVADRIVRGGGMAPLLDQVDGVHVLTSLTGFEALLRDCDVTCHGTPFYAGWGLTRDLATVPDRRGRQLTLDQLIAAVLIVYPRYLDPVTGLPCPPELLIQRIGEGAAPNRLGWITRIRQLQGRLLRGTR